MLQKPSQTQRGRTRTNQSMLAKRVAAPKTKKKTSHYASKTCDVEAFQRKIKRKMRGAKNKKNHPKPAPKPDFGAKAEKVRF